MMSATNAVKWIIRILGCFAVGLGIASLTGCHLQSGFLSPKGIIAYQERKLFFDTLALMLIVVLPVIVMSFAFVYHYQVSHRIKDYKPNWSHSYFLEALWWGIPCVIIFILAALTWKKTHDLDPYRPIIGRTEQPLIIQAIALPWKWLFIYPDSHIATINYLVLPVNQQVEFWITTDNVPMSALFVPQLGSQLYAMAGMRTRLHLLANQTGVFDGMNTQYNGGGFSDMRFPVHVVEPDKMQAWVKQMQSSTTVLTTDAYNQLLVPTIANKAEFFANADPMIFENALHIYMHTFGTVHPRTSSTLPTLKE